MKPPIFLIFIILLSGCTSNDTTEEIPEGNQNQPEIPIDLLPLKLTGQTERAVLIDLINIPSSGCELNITAHVKSTGDDPFSLGIIRNPAIPQSYYWLYSGNAEPLYLSAGGIDASGILAEDHAGKVTYSLRAGSAPNLEIMWMAINIDAEVPILFEGSCAESVQKVKYYDQVCLSDDGQLEGITAGSNYQKAVVDAYVECDNEAGEVGLFMTGNAQGSGSVSTPQDSWAFESVLGENHYQYRNSTAGNHSLKVESLLSNGNGLIWYVIGAPQN